MRKVLAFATLILMTSVFSLAMEKTWTGKISNSDCKSMGKKMAAHDRVIDCVEKGSKYVFVTGGKTYSISNQDMPDLKEHAAHTVKLTGEMTGKTIAVSKIEMPMASGKAKAKTKTY